MASLVLELQQAATSSKTPISELLRKALLVASKLGVAEFRAWVQNELKGYGDNEVPAYRVIRGHVQQHNPVRGLIPVLFHDDDFARRISTRKIFQSVGEMEELVGKEDKEGTLVIALPDSLRRKFAGDQFGFDTMLVISQSQIVGILDQVRNTVLEWSLKLEADGIVGENLTFSPQEKQRAAGHVYNIGTLIGVAGEVNSSNLQIGDYNSIREELERLGVPKQEREELKTTLEELKTAQGEEKRGLIAKATSWVVRNGDKLGSLSDTVRGWIEAIS